MILLSLLMTLEVLPLLHAGIVSSLVKMESLVQTQREVVLSLQSYIEKEKARLLFLKKQLEIYEREYVKATSLPDYFSNPINAFIFIKSLTVDLEMLENKMRFTTEYTRNSTLKYPGMNDFKEAAFGLERIRHIYLLNVTQLADGIINGIEYGTSMSSSDCYELARALLSEKRHDKAIVWMKQALRKYSHKESDILTFRAENIVEHIGYAYHSLGSYRKAAKWISRLLEMRPGDPEFIGHVKSLEMYERRIIQEDLSKTRSNWNFKYNFEKQHSSNLTNPDEVIMKVYEAMCRDMVTIPRSVDKRLKCGYLMKNHPFLRLAPIKMEQLYINPDVTLFHDVISDREIAHIKALATPYLTQGKIGMRLMDLSQLFDYRNVHISWMFDNASSTVARVTSRISDMTGLHAERSEPFQVGNYGLGGHYAPHVDGFSNGVNYENGNRIATVLLYVQVVWRRPMSSSGLLLAGEEEKLSNVAFGGATVFTALGVSVHPKRGSAVFWHNLLRSGELDPATSHAACPVVVGNKWMANKWIQDVGQEFARPCHLEDYEWGDRFTRNIPPPLKIRL